MIVNDIIIRLIQFGMVAVTPSESEALTLYCGDEIKVGRLPMKIRHIIVCDEDDSHVLLRLVYRPTGEFHTWSLV